MKLFKTRLRALAIALAALTGSSVVANAAPDTAYNTNDLMLFFQNPAGTVGTDQVVGFSLGSTWDVFRRAATPSDATYGDTINLGNINAALTTAYGADWTSFSSSIFAGAAGQNGNTSGLSSATSNQDYARTVYVTKPRTGAGSVGSSNSSSVTIPVATTAQGSLASNISGSNASIADGVGNPQQQGIANTVIDENNPFFAGNPSTAYGQISGGVMGALNSTTYSLGSISNIVLALDLYRATPVLDASGWQNINGISGVVAREGYYLGTITLSSNGEVNFVAVPEPSTYGLLALAGAVVFLSVRRRKAQQA